jgi:hypothetical protein
VSTTKLGTRKHGDGRVDATPIAGFTPASGLGYNVVFELTFDLALGPGLDLGLDLGIGHRSSVIGHRSSVVRLNPEYLCRVVTRQNQRREAAVRAAQAMQRIVEQ